MILLVLLLSFYVERDDNGQPKDAFHVATTYLCTFHILQSVGFISECTHYTSHAHMNFDTFSFGFGMFKNNGMCCNIKFLNQRAKCPC